MDLTIPTDVPELPDTRQVQIARPVYGRTISTLTDAVNGMLGLRCLRYVSHIYDEDGGASAPVHITGTHEAPRWWLSPMARKLWIGAWVLANGGTTLTPSVSISVLDHVTSAIIDGPIEWTPDRGLVLSNHLQTASDEVESFMETGWSDRGAGAEPRLLDVSGNGGKGVRLSVTTTEVRIYSIAVLEAYVEQPL